MCTVVLEKNHTNIRFLAINTILAKKGDFSQYDIVEEIQTKGVDLSDVVESCIEDLINNGLIYEIGSRYMVKNRQKRWSMM